MSETLDKCRAETSAHMIMQAQADRILTAIEPLAVVIGKDSGIMFRFGEDRIECSAVDESHTMMAFCEADMESSVDGGVRDYSAEPSDVVVNIDHLVSALKAFGSSVVHIASLANTVVIWNDSRRRTISVYSEALPIPHEIGLNVVAEVAIPVERLKELTGLDKIAESVHTVLSEGVLTIKCSSEVESSEIFVKTDYSMSLHSAYSSELLGAIVRRIKADEVVTIGLVDDSPMVLKFGIGCARYRMYLAPRIEEV